MSEEEVKKVVVVCKCGWRSDEAVSSVAWNQFYDHYAEQGERTRRNEHEGHEKTVKEE